MVRVLLGWDVLRRVAGDEDAYLSATGDVLYDVRRNVLAMLLSGARGPSTISADSFDARLAALADEPAPDTDELRNRTLRQRLTRRLLDDPVVYYTDLDEAELAYLVSQSHAITRRIEEATGLVAEVRAEGIAMVDPDDELPPSSSAKTRRPPPRPPRAEPVTFRRCSRVVIRRPDPAGLSTPWRDLRPDRTLRPHGPEGGYG